jgi:hypothetical protein
MKRGAQSRDNVYLAEKQLSSERGKIGSKIFVSRVFAKRWAFSLFKRSRRTVEMTWGETATKQI